MNTNLSAKRWVFSFLYTCFLFLTLILISPLTSANGLQVTTQEPILNINKTIDEDYPITLTITNADSFTFYNITFQENDIITMPTIPQLNSGSSINITARIKSNRDYNGSIGIIGFYLANLGASNVNREVEVTYDEGVTPCVFSIIKGDSVTWINNAGRDIVMKNSNSGDNIVTLIDGFNYTEQFNNPLTLNYYFSWLGFKFTQICSLTVLSDEGYITNPEHNTYINLSLKVTYIPTTISTTFLETDYIIPVYTTEQGLFLIKNTGDNTAKNIKIEGRWMSFTPNNFDLEPGFSRTVSYTISPDIIFTNQTDQTYEEIISINGNFEESQQRIKINIPYADIDSGEYTEGDSIINLFIRYCNENPNVVFCKTNPGVIYRNGSEGDNLTQEQFRHILEYMYTTNQGFLDYITWQKQETTEMKDDMNNITNNVGDLRSDVDRIKTENQGAVSMIYFIIIGFSLFICMGGLVWVYFHFKKEKKLAELRRF